MKGWIDRFDSTIAGWAYDPANSGEPVTIVVCHEHRELYRCKADLFRSDLIPVIGSGNHGFSFDPANIPQIIPDMVLTIIAIGSDSLTLKEERWTYQNVVAEGADGWLFLQNDSNNVNQRMAGLCDNDDYKIEETAMTFITRGFMLSKLGIPYRAIIIPEKNVACRKYWTHLSVSEHRPALRIIARAQAFGSKVIYPIDDISKHPETYFLKTDTHLNTNGYDYIVSILNNELPTLFGDTSRPARIKNPAFSGNLGEKLAPKRTEVADEYLFPDGPNHCFLANEIEAALQTGGTLRGGTIVLHNHRAPKKKILLFGTSSCYHFIPAASHFFYETLFIWENTFDYNIIKAYNPDCVLWLAAERFLPTACNDMLGLPDTSLYISRVLNLGNNGSETLTKINA